MRGGLADRGSGRRRRAWKLQLARSCRRPAAAAAASGVGSVQDPTHRIAEPIGPVPALWRRARPAQQAAVHPAPGRRLPRRVGAIAGAWSPRRGAASGTASGVRCRLGGGGWGVCPQWAHDKARAAGEGLLTFSVSVPPRGAGGASSSAPHPSSPPPLRRGGAVRSVRHKAHGLPPPPSPPIPGLQVASAPRPAAAHAGRSQWARPAESSSGRDTSLCPGPGSLQPRLTSRSPACPIRMRTSSAQHAGLPTSFTGPALRC